MAPLVFRFFALVLVLVLLLAGETSSHLGSASSVNINQSSMVMWQNVPIETVIASHMQIAVTLNSTKAGVQKFHTTLHRINDYPSPRETLTSKRYNFPFKFREDKFVPLENRNKATFDCQVELPFIGYTKPWIELETGNIYCIFFSYSKNMKPPHDHDASLKEAPLVSSPSFALLLGRLSVSGTGKMMNITSEVNNVIISILENSDVQVNWRKNDYLSMSLWEDFGFAQSEVKEQSVNDQIIVILSAGHQRVRMIIRYEMDESQIPMNENLLTYMIIMSFLNCIISVKLTLKWRKAAAEAEIEKKADTTKVDEKKDATHADKLKRSLYDVKKLSSEMICFIEKYMSEEV